MICGNGLMSNQPMIEETIKGDMHYLFEWLSAFNSHLSVELVDDKGNSHIYTWQNDVPLNGNAKTTNTNWFQYQFKNTQGKITRTHSWITDIEISRDNIIAMTKAGRSRWKIENECFNTFKNQGYHVEHNYGHEDKKLSYNMCLLTLLAFYIRQIFELTNDVNQACRISFGSKYHFYCLP
jgi:hypothetical protein